MKVILFKLVATALVFAISTSCLYSQEGTDEVNAILSDIKDKPDWTAINKGLLERYDQTKSDSITLHAKVEYYWRKKDYDAYTKEYFLFVEKNQLATDAAGKNRVAWRVFSYAISHEQLRQAKIWVVEALDAEPTNAYYMDKYANILYKMGDDKHALVWQNYAVMQSQWNPIIIENLFKMKAGIATWKYPEAKAVQNPVAEQKTWAGIHAELKRNVDSLVWQARINVARSQSKAGYATAVIQYVGEFKPVRSAAYLNEDAWNVFLNSTDEVQLKTALTWSDQALKDPKIADARHAYLDTNANLLYKLGRKREAIAIQQKALALAPESEKSAYEATLTKMEQGLPTWHDEIIVDLPARLKSFRRRLLTIDHSSSFQIN